MFLIWWDIKGIQHYGVLKSGETVTTDHYSRQFRSFRAAHEEKFNYKTNWKSHTALLQTSPIHSENYKESWDFFSTRGIFNRFGAMGISLVSLFGGGFKDACYVSFSLINLMRLIENRFVKMEYENFRNVDIR